MCYAQIAQHKKKISSSTVMTPLEIYISARDKVGYGNYKAQIRHNLIRNSCQR
jgi:hypothetical protein